MLFFGIIKVVSITSSKLSRTFTLLHHRSFLVFSRKMVWTEVVSNEPEVKPGKFCCLHSFLFRLALYCTGLAISQFTFYLFLLNFVLFKFGMILYFLNFTKQFIFMNCLFSACYCFFVSISIALIPIFSIICVLLWISNSFLHDLYYCVCMIHLFKD